MKLEYVVIEENNFYFHVNSIYNPSHENKKQDNHVYFTPM